MLLKLPKTIKARPSGSGPTSSDCTASYPRARNFSVIVSATTKAVARASDAARTVAGTPGCRRSREKPRLASRATIRIGAAKRRTMIRSGCPGVDVPGSSAYAGRVKRKSTGTAIKNKRMVCNGGQIELTATVFITRGNTLDPCDARPVLSERMLQCRLRCGERVTEARAWRVAGVAHMRLEKRLLSATSLGFLYVTVRGRDCKEHLFGTRH